MRTITSLLSPKQRPDITLTSARMHHCPCTDHLDPYIGLVGLKMTIAVLPDIGKVRSAAFEESKIRRGKGPLVQNSFDNTYGMSRFYLQWLPASGIRDAIVLWNGALQGKPAQLPGIPNMNRSARSQR